MKRRLNLTPSSTATITMGRKSSSSEKSSFSTMTATMSSFFSTSTISSNCTTILSSTSSAITGTTTTSSSSSSSSSSTASDFDYNHQSFPQEWQIYVLVTIVALICYANGLQGDFVHDDIPAITMNKDVLAISPWPNVFRNDFWGTPMGDINSHKSYRPLTTLSFRLNYLLFGLRPIWFHTTNVILHAAVCVLFTRVCYVVAGLRRNFAFIAGILFAVHPIHTEAVTGIVGRADVLACVFFLVSLLVYHGNEEDPDSLAVWLSIFLGGLSMLAKETGITVFLLNLACDTYRSWPSLKRSITDVRWSEETHQFGRRVLRVLISMGVLLVVRLALLQGSLPKFSQQDNPTAFHPNFYVRVLTFFYLAAFNWWLVLCPTTLSHDWQMGSIPLLTSLSDPRNILTFLAVIAAIMLAYRGIMDLEEQRHVPLVLGFLLLVLPFLPATNVVVTVGFVVAERVLYIPSLGCVLLVVYGAQLLWETMPKYRLLLTLMGIVLLLAGSCKTVARNRDWLSRESLLRSGLIVLPHNAKMHYNFGNFLRDSSKPDLAILHYKQALSLWPTYASAHNNLGTLMSGPEIAEHHFLEAIRYSADHVNAHYNLGQLYRKTNRSSDAMKMLERCVTLAPKFIPGHLELYRLSSEYEGGQILKRIIKLTPRDSNHLNLYGNWLLEHHFLLEALQQFQRALRADETNQMSLVGACRTLRQLGQRSRLHQVVVRWQMMVRLANGGLPRQTDIYLRDWVIKLELRNRAMIYDAGVTITPCNPSLQQRHHHHHNHHPHHQNHHHQATHHHNHVPSRHVNLGIVRTYNCNRSDNLYPLMRETTVTDTASTTTTASTTITTTATTDTTRQSPTSDSSIASRNICSKHCRNRRWHKVKHKQQIKDSSPPPSPQPIPSSASPSRQATAPNPTNNIDSSTTNKNTVVPLLVPNFLDKL